MPSLHDPRMPAPLSEDGRTSTGRAAAGLPFKPYVYRGNDQDEPPAVTAARERHRALNAKISQLQAQASEGCRDA